MTTPLEVGIAEAEGMPRGGPDGWKLLWRQGPFRVWVRGGQQSARLEDLS